MIIKLSIIALSILGLIFVVMPYFNYAVFDFQCGQVGCSDCAANRVYEPKVFCKPQDSATAGCNKDCKVRNYKCGFDEGFSDSCLRCVQDCKNNEALTQEDKIDCFNKCHQSS